MSQKSLTREQIDKITEEVCHVRRYEWSGWRIEEEK